MYRWWTFFFVCLGKRGGRKIDYSLFWAWQDRIIWAGHSSQRILHPELLFLQPQHIRPLQRHGRWTPSLRLQRQVNFQSATKSPAIWLQHSKIKDTSKSLVNISIALLLIVDSVVRKVHKIRRSILDRLFYLFRSHWRNLRIVDSLYLSGLQ